MSSKRTDKCATSLCRGEEQFFTAMPEAARRKIMVPLLPKSACDGDGFQVCINVRRHSQFSATVCTKYVCDAAFSRNEIDSF
jgi:hypothetical protein